MPRTTTPSGFSLLELLVVLVILGLLTGLILSGVQKVRATAARTECANRVKQLVLGVVHYHDSQHRFPPGYTAGRKQNDFPYLAWTARTLPYLERQAMWHDIAEAYRSDPKPLSFAGHPPHALILKTVVLSFLCPSDGRISTFHKGNGVETAFTSYLGVSGTNYIQKNGLFFEDSQIRSADVRDGTSNTILIGERPPSADFRLGWWYRGWGLYEDGAAEMLLGVRERNLSADYPLCPPGPYQFQADRINNDCALFHFWSLHPGGANFAFADGSVRFLRYSANDVLPALATRAGGETATVPD